MKDSLEALKGVDDASVNLATEKATFVYDPSMVSMDDIGKAVNAAGYEVARDEVSLTIGGMHCATCSTTVGDALREVPGVVDAKVNFALGKAVVEYDSRDRLTGPPQEGRREGRVQGPGGRGRPRREDRAPERVDEGFRDLTVAALFAVPLAFISMTYDLWMTDLLDMQLRNYILFALATPVQFYAGFRYYKGAYRALVNRRSNMDTLVVLDYRRLRLQPARHIPAGRDRLDARVLRTCPPS